MHTDARKQRARRLVAARLTAGLTQEFVAQRLGCSRQSVSAKENGASISVDELSAMCVMYGCTADSILFDAPSSGRPDDHAISSQFARLDPWLRERLWMLYQVFIRPGAKPDVKTPS